MLSPHRRNPWDQQKWIPEFGGSLDLGKDWNSSNSPCGWNCDIKYCENIIQSQLSWNLTICGICIWAGCLWEHLCRLVSFSRDQSVWCKWHIHKFLTELGCSVTLRVGRLSDIVCGKVWGWSWELGKKCVFHHCSLNFKHLNLCLNFPPSNALNFFVPDRCCPVVVVSPRLPPFFALIELMMMISTVHEVKCENC
jgi:hypothetical protein